MGLDYLILSCKQLLTFDLQEFMQVDDLPSPYPVQIWDPVPLSVQNERPDLNVHVL